MTSGYGWTPGPLVVRRRLSVDGEPLVAVGDEVGADTALLSMATFPGRVLRSPVSHEMRISPQETEACLVRAPGEMVKEGEIIARSSLFWSHRLARSRHEGSVAGVSGSLGVVYLREHIPTQIAETVKINVVSELKGDKNHFDRYIRVRDGDKVEKGQVIASRQSGTRFFNVLSPVFGTIAHVAPLLGTLSVIPDAVSSVLTAHIPGIVAFCGAREAILAGYGIEVDGLLGLGGEAHGPLVVKPNEPSSWRPGESSSGLEGAVLVVGRADAESLRAAAGLGVAGVIAGRVHERDLCEFGGRELGVIATGDEDVPLVLVVTDGFGPGVMGSRLHALLGSHAGRLASLSGTTHIRAGVIRPRVLVSLDRPDRFREEVLAGAGDLVGLVQGKRVEELPELSAGARVRVLRGTHRGRSGIVLDLPESLHAVGSGARVPVARVELECGCDGSPETVLVAQSNLRREAEN